MWKVGFPGEVCCEFTRKQDGPWGGGTLSNFNLSQKPLSQSRNWLSRKTDGSLEQCLPIRSSVSIIIGCVDAASG